MNKKVYSIIALILCALMVLGVIVPALVSVCSATTPQQEINNLQDNLTSLNKKKSQLNAELKSISNNIANASKQKEKIDQQIDVTGQEIDVLNQMLDKLSVELQTKETELSNAQAKADEQYQDLRTRIRATYEQGSVSYLEVLLSSDSYSACLTNMDIISNILEQDQKMFDDLKASVENIKALKANVEQAISQQQQAKDELTSKKSELEGQLSQSAALINKLAADKEAYKKQYDQAEAEEKALKKEIDALLASLSSSQYVGGTFTWPLPGITKITCYFGMRTHPITGVYKMHTGIDIAAPYGTTVVAANMGTVITSGYNSAYGNYIVIDHGGNVATLYAHMSKLLVSKGSKVTKGQQIGKVGSTGFSTGNHLHFEIIKNGKYIDPMSEFKKVG